METGCAGISKGQRGQIFHERLNIEWSACYRKAGLFFDPRRFQKNLSVKHGIWVNQHPPKGVQKGGVKKIIIDIRTIYQWFSYKL